MFLSTSERLSTSPSLSTVRERHSAFGKLVTITISCSPSKKLALELAVAHKKHYSTVTKYGVRDERVQSKNFLTDKMKTSIFHLREQGATEVHPLFITSLGRGIIKITEV